MEEKYVSVKPTTTIITLFDIDAYRLIIENVSSFEPSSLIYNVKSWQDCDNMLSIKSVI